MFHACSALVLTAEQICQWGSARASFSNKVIANDRSGIGAMEQWQWQIVKIFELAGTGLAPIESLAFRHKTKNYGQEEPVVYDGDEHNDYKS